MTWPKSTADVLVCFATDERGVVRVWHANEVVQGVYFKLKSEKPALSGPVNDLAWSPDSTKIVAVGHGRDKCAASPHPLSLQS